MRAEDRAVARRNLDKRLSSLGNPDGFTRPPKGWVRAIREALGMTTAQLGKRIGVSQSRAFDIEKAEVSGKLTLESLERAAHALDCRLVYALVPREPLQSLAEARAFERARKHLSYTSHSMALEDQSVNAEYQEFQIRVAAQRLLEKSRSTIWEDE